MTRTDLFARQRRRRRVRTAAATVIAVGALGGATALGIVGADSQVPQDEPTAPSADASPPATPEPQPTEELDRPVGAEAAPETSAEPEPTPSQPPTGPDAPERLVTDVAEILADDDLGDIAELSALVIDADGTVIAGHEPGSVVMPASTNKLVTAGAALDLLGPDYRYVTRVVATGPVEDGVVDGDLVLVGEGDPSLASPAYVEDVYPARPHTRISALAKAVAAAGIERVNGAVLGDPGPFAEEPTAEGWRDRYFATLDATLASGLTVDAGRRLVERNGTLYGRLAEDPALVASEVLADLLEEADVEVAAEPGRGSAPPGATEIARVQSPPLSELLSHAVRRSDNHMADALFRTLGARVGDGTWEGGGAAVRAALSDVDVDWSTAVIPDGSGLSRDGRLSAEMLVELDRAMTELHGQDWRGLMAVMGESGTLRSRLRGTPAQGRVSGKTGSLRDARALVARAEPPEGGPYHFAVLGAELAGEELAAVRTLIDDLSVRLAGG